MALKYLKIRDQLQERLETMAAGEPLPAERALAAELDVARMTLRRALDELEKEGRIVRRHGAGVFAADSKLAQLLQATSFTEDMRRRGLVPGARTLSSRMTIAGARLGGPLEVSPGDHVFRIERLRLADGEPMAIELLSVAEAVAPGLTGEDLEGQSFYALLGERYGVSIASGLQAIEPTVTDERESELLTVPLHSPAFLFERTSRDAEGRVVEFVRSLYRGDRYRLVSHLSPPSALPAPHRVGPHRGPDGRSGDG